MSQQKPGIFSRFGAYMIDWFIGDLFASFPIVLMYSMMNDTTELVRRLDSLGLVYGFLAGVLSFAFSFFYFVMIPFKWMPGQTVGKKICGICIVTGEGMKPGFKTLVIRQIVGLILVEGCLMSAGSYIRELLTLTAGTGTVSLYLCRIQAAVTLLTCLFTVFGRSGKAFHDYLAGTAVIKVRSVQPELESGGE